MTAGKVGMSRNTRLGTVVAITAALAAGCFGPEGSRPGMHLRGEVVATPPSDWTFTNDHKEIAIEVHTPYLLPHSVAIWCAAVDGKLYVGSRNPETKRWPGWVDRDPDVRLGIGSKVYEVRLAPVDDPDVIERVRQAYGTKYNLPQTPPQDSPPIRYWRVERRT